jgi:DNA recombination protein RmuC
MTETIDLTNPLIQIGAGALALMILLLWMGIRASQKSAQLMEPLSYQISALGQRVQSLGELQQRLSAIDKAQKNITKLSGNVLSLQDILSNKKTRGAFGEIQLNDIVTKALPSDSYTLQATLSNGRRADCLIHLPNPPGPIAVDSKFPLEAYEAIRNASSDREVNDAAKLLRTAVRKHIKDISEKYIIEGETADGALMPLTLKNSKPTKKLHQPHLSETVFDAFQCISCLPIKARECV